MGCVRVSPEWQRFTLMGSELAPSDSEDYRIQGLLLHYLISIATRGPWTCEAARPYHAEMVVVGTTGSVVR